MTYVKKEKKMKKFMGTLLKIILIIAVAIVLGIVAFIILAQYREANYYQYTEAVGRIEKKYTALGEHKVSYQEVDADNDVIGKYAIWYPSKLKSKDNKYPVVIFAKATDKVIARKKNVDQGIPINNLTAI